MPEKLTVSEWADKHKTLTGSSFVFPRYMDELEKKIRETLTPVVLIKPRCRTYTEARTEFNKNGGENV